VAIFIEIPILDFQTTQEMFYLEFDAWNFIENWCLKIEN